MRYKTLNTEKNTLAAHRTSKSAKYENNNRFSINSSHDVPKEGYHGFWAPLITQRRTRLNFHLKIIISPQLTRLTVFILESLDNNSMFVKPKNISINKYQ